MSGRILSIVLYIMNRPRGESKEPILLEPRDERRSRDAELEKIPYYQELRPADSFTGAMMKTARRRTFLIFVPVAIYVLWSIIAG